MILKEKLPFIWSTLLPIIFLIANGQAVTDVMHLNFFWSFIIMSSYVFGVGLHAVRLREQGLLKTYFSINQSRTQFFVANILTQITFAFFSVLTLNLVATVIYKLNFFLSMFYSMILIVMALPIAFLSINLTMIKKSTFNTVNTVVTIIFFISLMLINMTGVFNYLNPLLYTSKLLAIGTHIDILIYVFSSIVFILSGLFCIKKYEVNSIMRR